MKSIPITKSSKFDKIIGELKLDDGVVDQLITLFMNNLRLEIKASIKKENGKYQLHQVYLEKCGMIIEHVCPKAERPVKGEIIGNGTIVQEVWEAKEGLFGPEIQKWKSIKVRCSYCGKVHEYALTIKHSNVKNPKDY